MFVLADKPAFSFLGLLALFIVVYYTFYPVFSKFLQRDAAWRERLWKIGDKLDWKALTYGAVLVYLATVALVMYKSKASPLGAALSGADLMGIAIARDGFFTGLHGPDAVLRYIAVILGRAVMPLLLVYLYYIRHRLRHVALFVILLAYMVSLEKAGAIFAITPIILLFIFQKKWQAVFLYSLFLPLCVGLWTFLAVGGIHNNLPPSMQAHVAEQPISPPVASPPQTEINTDQIAKTQQNAERRRIFNFLPFENIWRRRANLVEGDLVSYNALFMVNRIIWIPYITAYDWLRFQDDVLGGKLSMGKSILGISWLQHEEKMPIEQMVYDYQFGKVPGITGSSNTVFFVDAKLAFGWIGAFIYCLLFTLLSAIIFSSRNEALKIASFVVFFTASLSALTATMLSGGLLLYAIICLLLRKQ